MSETRAERKRRAREAGYRRAAGKDGRRAPIRSASPNPSGAQRAAARQDRARRLEQDQAVRLEARPSGLLVARSNLLADGGDRRGE